MKWSFASVGLIMLGLFGIIIIMLFNDITVSNEQDYYTLKYATEAAMIESVDAAYYRLTGKVKMSQEKFVENFTRRFTETSTFGEGNYNIEFFQIIEYPAKVSLRIVDRSGDYNIYTYTTDVDTTNTNIVNELSAILDTEQLEIVKNPINRPTPTPTVKPRSNYSYPSTPNVPYTPSWPSGGSSFRPSSSSSSSSSGGGCSANCCLCGTCGGSQCYNAGKSPNLGDGYADTRNYNAGTGGDNWGINGNGQTVGWPAGGGPKTSSRSTGGGSSGSGSTGGGSSRSGSTGGGSSSSKGCFLADTKISTIEGYKDIAKIKIGDYVLTYNEGTKNNEYHKVTNIFAYSPDEINEELYTLTFEDNTNLKMTSSHRIYLMRDNQALWLQAQDVKIGDNIMHADKSIHKIVKIEYTKLKNYVYNFSVESTHNYYVGDNQILVHNPKPKDVK